MCNTTKNLLNNWGGQNPTRVSRRKPGNLKSNPLKKAVKRCIFTLSYPSHKQNKTKQNIILLHSSNSTQTEACSCRSSMALSSLNLHKFIFNTTTNLNYQHHHQLTYYKTKTKNIGSIDRVRLVGGRCCSSAIAINSPSSLTGVTGIRWGSTKLQGAREEMEDDVVIVKSSADHDLDGFSFAAVFDGHAGYSSVKFLRFLHFVTTCVLSI